MLKFPIQHPWLTLFFVVLFVAASCLGFKNFKIETDYEIFFDGTDKRLEALHELENTFGRRDTVQFTLDFKDQSAFSRDNLTANRFLTERSWELPFSRRVDSLTNFTYTYVQGDDFEVSEIFESPKELSDEELQRRKQFAINEPALQNALNTAHTMSGVLVWINIPGKDAKATHNVSIQVKELAKEFKTKYPDVDLYINGSILLSEAFFQESTKGLGKLLLIMFATFLVLVAIQLRSVSAVISITLVVILAIITTLGLANWLHISFTAPSSSVPIIVCALAIANIVHVITLQQQRFRKTLDRKDSIHYAMAINVKAISVTSLTTIIGFLCLNFSSVPPYRMLGNVAAIGALIVFLFTFTLLPALLTIFASKKITNPHSLLSFNWQKFAQRVVSKRKLLLAFNMLVILSIIPFIMLNKIDDRLVNYFDQSTDIRTHSDFAMEHLAPFYGVSYAVNSLGENGIHEYEYLEGLDRFTNWLRQQPEVMYVNSWSDTIKRLNKNMHQDEKTWYRVPESRELASQYALLYELSLPYGLDLTTVIDINKSSTKVFVGMRNVSSSEMRAFESRAQTWIESNLPHYMHSQASGPPLLFAHIWDKATKSNLSGMLIAVALVSLVLMLALRSLSLGIISLVPNLLPALLAFGVWGLVNGEINIASSIIAIITFGIVVDDTVHFLTKYQHARNKGLNKSAAIEYTFTKVGNALFVTTVTLMCGFLVLCFSPFLLNSVMGLLTAIAFFFALLLDFLLLPTLLMGRTSSQKVSPQN